MKFKANSTQVSIVLDDKTYTVKNGLIEANEKYTNILKIHGFEVYHEEEKEVEKTEDKKTLTLKKR